LGGDEQRASPNRVGCDGDAAVRQLRVEADDDNVGLAGCLETADALLGEARRGWAPVTTWSPASRISRSRPLAPMTSTRRTAGNCSRM
jgi:hypothetical protein